MDFKGSRRRLFIDRLTIALVVALLNIPLIGCSSSGNAPPAGGPPGTQTTYATSFPLAENPISESGNWVNGGTTGIDWGNVQTSSHLAYGVTMPGTYADPTAVLTGTWPSDQFVQATVSIPSSQGTGCCHEVELRFRTTIASHSITGYELNCSTVPAFPYLGVVRWNGAINDFTGVGSQVAQGCANGDVLAVTMVGSTITVYKNGVKMTQVADSTYTNGSPGIGFYDNPDSSWNSFGFSNFFAGNAGQVQ
jgi:hypothetical protein